MSSKRREEEEAEEGERWLITYADMITLLMVFFVVLYSMANTDLKKFAAVAKAMQVAFNVGGGLGEKSGEIIGGATGGIGSGANFFQGLPPRQRDFASVTATLSSFASQAGIHGEISVNMNTEGIVISLSNALLFEPGSAEVRLESVETLQKVAEILKTTDHLVRVEGHTDNIPTNSPMYPTNWELSVARAVAIVRFLVEEEGIPPERLSAAGYAEFKPRVANDSRANRALNRRADIVIVYPEQSRSFTIGSPTDTTTGGESTTSGDFVTQESQ
jgi:chemotaxis protein MotB